MIHRLGTPLARSSRAPRRTLVSAPSTSSFMAYGPAGDVVSESIVQVRSSSRSPTNFDDSRRRRSSPKPFSARLVLRSGQPVSSGSKERTVFDGGASQEVDRVLALIGADVDSGRYVPGEARQPRLNLSFEESQQDLGLMLQIHFHRYPAKRAGLDLVRAGNRRYNGTPLLLTVTSCATM